MRAWLCFTRRLCSEALFARVLLAVNMKAECVSWPRFWHWGTGPLRGCVCWQMSLCLPHELLGPAGALQAHSCRGKAARSGDCSPCSCGGEQLMCCVKDRQRDTARPLHASPRRPLCLARHHHAYRNGMVRDKEYHFSRDRAVVSEIDCGLPGVPPHGVLTGEKFTFGSTVHYTCSSGRELVGEAARTCQLNGHWSAPLPHCSGAI